MIFLQDTTTVAPVITTGSDLLAFFIATVAGLASGYLTILYQKGKDLLTNADHTIQVLISAVLGFALVKLSVFLGASLPADILGLNTAAFATIVSGVLGKVIALFSKTAPPSAPSATISTGTAAGIKKS